ATYVKLRSTHDDAQPASFNGTKPGIPTDNEQLTREGPRYRPGDKDPFVSYYRNSLCNLQKVNNDLLRKIFKKNRSCAYLADQSISFLSSNEDSSSISNEEEYLFIDEFRQKLPLTTYENYRDYIDRMVDTGEKNLLSSDKIVYYASSSGTTGKIKLLPITSAMFKHVFMLFNVGQVAIWRSLPASSFPLDHQRLFSLQSGKRFNAFLRSKDGTPIGPFSQFMSALSFFPGSKLIGSSLGILDYELIEGISDFETSTFVQLVFALTVQDISSYSVTFASSFLHTVKVIENHFEEMCLCISSSDFNHSSLVHENIHDGKFRTSLNQALENVTLEYGGSSYRSERVHHIRRECLKKNTPGLLPRLWPQLVFASTSLGSSFAMYKKEIEFYCGTQLPLINCPIYGASEAFFGSLASIYTNEYFLSPTSAFYEFIEEEDIHQ
ncbi:unnamed protein product, partial [Rotaria magnacalcarata]